MRLAMVGRWAFIFGIVLAILLGFLDFQFASIVLVILGLIVGFINITEKESHKYLLAVIALLLIGFSGLQIFAMLNTGVSDWIQRILTAFVTFVSASGLVVAIKEVFILGEE